MCILANLVQFTTIKIFLFTVVRHLQAEDNLDKHVPFALIHPIKCSPEMRCYASQKHL